jgi:hypothetical protein
MALERGRQIRVAKVAKRHRTTAAPSATFITVSQNVRGSATSTAFADGYRIELAIRQNTPDHFHDLGDRRLHVRVHATAHGRTIGGLDSDYDGVLRHWKAQALGDRQHLEKS